MLVSFQFRTSVSVAVVMDSDKLDVQNGVVDVLTPFRTKKKRLIPSRRRNSGMFGR